MIFRSVPILLLLGVLASARGQPETGVGDSWRRLTVRVRSDATGRPLPGARVEVDVVGAPVWDAPRVLRTDAGGRVRVWIPRWGGPVRVEAEATDHLPARMKAGAEATATILLPHLPREQNRIQLRIAGADGALLPSLVIPAHAALVVRAYGSDPDPDCYAMWTVPAREAFEQGLSLPSGVCDLSIRAASWIPTWTRLRVPVREIPALPLPERSLDPLVVRVVDVDTREPLAEALVRYGGWGEGQIRTDEAGRVTIPFLPAVGAPETLRIEWSMPGYERTRLEVTGEDDGPPEWVLGMRREAPHTLSLVEADESPVASGVAWSTRRSAPGRRWHVEGGRVDVGMPSTEEESDVRFFFASASGFASRSAAAVRAVDRVVLRPWRRVRAIVDRAGEACPGSCEVGLHLLEAGAAAIRTVDLAPWLWTAPISAAGEIDTVVPEGPDAILQVNVGARTAFFAAERLSREGTLVLRLGSETEADRRTLLLADLAEVPLAGVELALRWVPPDTDPRPLAQLYGGVTDASGRFHHYGPQGPYEVWAIASDGSSQLLSDNLTYLNDRGQVISCTLTRR